MQISHIGKKLTKAKALLKTTIQDDRIQFLQFILMLAALTVSAFKGALEKENNRTEPLKNIFCISCSNIVTDFINSIIRFLMLKRIKSREQNPYLYKLTYGKDGSDLITDDYTLKVSHTVNAYSIMFPVMSIVMFFVRNSRVRINLNVFFHPLIMSLALIEFIRYATFYPVWKELLKEQKILDELTKLDPQDSILREQNENVIIALEKNKEDMKIKTIYKKQILKRNGVELSFWLYPFYFSFLKVLVNLFTCSMYHDGIINLEIFWDSFGAILGSLNSWRILYMSKSNGNLKTVGDRYNRNLALKIFLENQRIKLVKIEYDPYAHAVICKNLKIANPPRCVVKKENYSVEHIVQEQLKKDSILEVDEIHFSPGVTIIHSKNNEVNATFFKALNDQWIHMGGRTPKTRSQITMPCSKYEEVLYLPKNTFLPLYKNLVEAIICPRTLKSFKNKESLFLKVEMLMHQLGLSRLSKTLMTRRSEWGTITSGELKRLLLIRAILFNPKVLCLEGLIDGVGDYAQDMINLLKEHLPHTVILISSTEPHKNLKNTTTASVHNKLLSFSKPSLNNMNHHASFLDKTLWKSEIDFSNRKLKATL